MNIVYIYDFKHENILLNNKKIGGYRWMVITKNNRHFVLTNKITSLDYVIDTFGNEIGVVAGTNLHINNFSKIAKDCAEGKFERYLVWSDSKGHTQDKKTAKMCVCPDENFRFGPGGVIGCKCKGS